MSKQLRDERNSLVDKYNVLALKSFKSEFDAIDLEEIKWLLDKKEKTITRILFPLLIDQLERYYEDSISRGQSREH